MRKLLFIIVLLCSISVYAQDHTSLRGRVYVSESAGITSFDFNLIRTGPEASKVVFGRSYGELYFEGGAFRPAWESFNPYDSKGPSASYLFEYDLSGGDKISRAEFTVRVMLEQKGMPMGDWPGENWKIILYPEPGKTTYMVKGSKY